MPEVVDAAARAEIRAHKEVCEQIYKNHEASFKRNDEAHSELHHTIKSLRVEAAGRWKWLVGLIITTLLTIVGGLLAVAFELATINSGPMH